MPSIRINHVRIKRDPHVGNFVLVRVAWIEHLISLFFEPLLLVRGFGETDLATFT